MGRLGQMTRRFLLIPLLLVMLVAGGLTACIPGSSDAARVGSYSISEKSFLGEIQIILANRTIAQSLDQQLGGDGTEQPGTGIRPGGANTINAQFVSSYLTSKIAGQMLDTYLRDHQLEIDPAVLANAEQEVNAMPAFSDFAEAFRKQAARENAAHLTVQKHYLDSNPEKYQLYCVSHILMSTQEAADAAKVSLDAGKSFDTVTAEVTKDPETGTGGELQCVLAQSLVQPLGDTVREMHQGEVQGPIRSQHGYHLLLLRETKPLTLDLLTSDPNLRQVDPAQDALDEVAKSVKVWVNPRFGTFQIGERGGVSVTPPHAKALPEGTRKTPEATNDWSSLLQQMQSGGSGAEGGGVPPGTDAEAEATNEGGSPRGAEGSAPTAPASPAP